MFTVGFLVAHSLRKDDTGTVWLVIAPQKSKVEKNSLLIEAPVFGAGRLADHCCGSQTGTGAPTNKNIGRDRPTLPA